eukprot:5311212-Prymnesium_polylepis.1
MVRFQVGRRVFLAFLKGRRVTPLLAAVCHTPPGSVGMEPMDTEEGTDVMISVVEGRKRSRRSVEFAEQRLRGPGGVASKHLRRDPTEFREHRARCQAYSSCDAGGRTA